MNAILLVGWLWAYSFSYSTADITTSTETPGVETYHLLAAGTTTRLTTPDGYIINYAR